MRFLAPTAFEDQRIGCRPAPPGRLPSSVFCRPLRGLSSLTPAALFRAAAALGVSRPSEPFPDGQLCQARHLVIPSQRLNLRPEGFRLRSQGFSYAINPYPASECFIREPDRCSPGLSALSRRSCALGWPSLDGSSAPDLSFGSVLAHFRSGPSAFPTPGHPAFPALASASRPSVFGLPCC